MQYADSLREVKKAESEVRDLKADAQRQAAQVLRDAERQANQLLEQARAESEAAAQATLAAATKKAEGERKKRLESGDRDAAAIRARATGGDAKAAVDLLVQNFEKRILGK